MITDVYGHCRMTGCYSLRVDWTSRLLVKHHSIWLVSHSTISLTTQDFNYTLISHLLQNKSFIVFFLFCSFSVPVICFILFVISILISASTTGGEGETAACKPTDVFLINCGATSNTSDTTGQAWTRDQQKDHGLSSVSTHSRFH